jgi:mRNA-degrading endonuclease RelE of RelBE toxin-antitoxin system
MRRQQEKAHKEKKQFQYAIRITDSVHNSILRLCKDTNTKRSEFISAALENAIESLNFALPCE